jgi:hypothetical protein
MGMTELGEPVRSGLADALLRTAAGAAYIAVFATGVAYAVTFCGALPIAWLLARRGVWDRNLLMVIGAVLGVAPFLTQLLQMAVGRSANLSAPILWVIGGGASGAASGWFFWFLGRPRAEESELDEEPESL